MFVHTRGCEWNECLHPPTNGVEDRLVGQGVDGGQVLKRWPLSESRKMKPSAKCKNADCCKQKSYGFKGQWSQFCKSHMLPGMINVTCRRCENTECVVRASFGEKGTVLKRFCVLHKQKDMVDLTLLKCKFTKCDNVRSYGVIGKSAQFCEAHKTPEMVNFKSKVCVFEGCKQRAVFGHSKRITVFCIEHKKPEMIMSVDRTCKHDECVVRAGFGFEGGKPQFCFEHKEDNMVLKTFQKCEFPECRISRTYGYEGKRAQFCFQHKETSMINVRGKLCEEKNCKTRPNYGFKGGPKQFCKTHKLQGMIDLVHKKCKTDWCTTLATNPRYKGYCLMCCLYEHPDIEVIRNYKTKEKAVAEAIKANFPSFSWTHDKRIEEGCSRRRPDFFLDLFTHVLIVEVDENKHETYDCSCENKRLMQISADVCHRPIVCIRFNPDEYTNSSGLKVKSCWSRTMLGVPVVPKTRISEWNHRLNVLIETIQFWTMTVSEKTLEVVELFY